MMTTLTPAEYAARIESMLRDCKPAAKEFEAVRQPDNERTAEMVSDRR